MEILLDTGSARTLVRKELVPEGKVLGGTMVGVRCAHGEVVHYQIATLEVAVGVCRGSVHYSPCFGPNRTWGVG